MSRGSHRGHLDWQTLILGLEVATVLVLLFFAAISRSDIVSSYSRDVINHEAYCATSYSAKKQSEEKDCQSLWYRSLNDPSILYSLAGAWINTALFFAAISTIVVTLRNSSQQRDDARRLFIADQRPWLKVDIELRAPFFKTNSKGDVQVLVNVTYKNIGKTPAINVSQSWLNKHIVDVSVPRDEDSQKEFKRCDDPFAPAIDNARLNASQRSMFNKGVVYPGQSVTYPQKTFINKADVDRTWAAHHICMVMLYIPVYYSSVIDDKGVYESTMVYAISSGMFYSYAIPRSEEELAALHKMLDAAESVGAIPDYACRPYLRLDEDRCVIS